MDFKDIIFDTGDGVATITLNRPERMNAFSERMLADWTAALEECQRDEGVKAVVLTGAGRGFCAGGDMKDAAQGYGLGAASAAVVERRNALRNTVHRVARAAAQLDKPYIAAVNGAAVGAGMDMASMCDLRFAAESARFAMSYVRVGLIPGDAGCYFLPRIVGMAKALELIWTGDFIDAGEALRIGYVSRVYPDDQLLAETRAFARRLAEGPAVAVQLAKRLAYRSQEVELDHALDLAQYGMLIAQSTEDAVEGPRAFVEKRQPRFTGR